MICAARIVPPLRWVEPGHDRAKATVRRTAWARERARPNGRKRKRNGRPNGRKRKRNAKLSGRNAKLSGRNAKPSGRNVRPSAAKRGSRNASPTRGGPAHHPYGGKGWPARVHSSKRVGKE